MLTQLARVSEARKIELDRVEMTVTPRFEQTGSIGADNAESRFLGVDTKLDLESSAEDAEVARLVATAERMCFMLDVIRAPHEVTSSVSLNGTELG
ncbi:MAG: OsmC family protein [Myxococcota bacterium]